MQLPLRRGIGGDKAGRGRGYDDRDDGGVKALELPEPPPDMLTWFTCGEAAFEEDVHAHRDWGKVGFRDSKRRCVSNG